MLQYCTQYATVPQLHSDVDKVEIHKGMLPHLSVWGVRWHRREICLCEGRVGRNFLHVFQHRNTSAAPERIRCRHWPKQKELTNCHGSKRAAEWGSFHAVCQWVNLCPHKRPKRSHCRSKFMSACDISFVLPLAFIMSRDRKCWGERGQ